MNMMRLHTLGQLAARRFLPAVLLITGMAVAMPASGQLVSYDQAARLGLERVWFAQVGLDRTRHRIASWLLYHDRLYAMTTAGSVHAMDAETGELLWTEQIGQPDHPALGPAANDKFLAMVSGSKLILLDRHDGRMVWSREVSSAPSSGPAINADHAFVALFSGRVEGYQIDAPDKPAWYSQSAGRTYFSPTATNHSISWPTDLGYLYVSRPKPLGVIYRLEMNDQIVALPVQMGSHLLVGSLDGYLYCIGELDGRERWRHSTGYFIISPPAVVGEQVFVASQQPMLHALEASTGQTLWTAGGVTRFVARGKKRAYGMDSHGSLLVLDSKTGGRLGRLKATEGGTAIVNDQSDRIYLVTDRGLVQCLHEIGVDKPILYRKPESKEEDDAKPTGEEANPKSGEDQPLEAKQEPTDSDTPDSEETPAAPPATDPFGELSNPFE